MLISILLTPVMSVTSMFMILNTSCSYAYLPVYLIHEKLIFPHFYNCKCTLKHHSMQKTALSLCQCQLSFPWHKYPNLNKDSPNEMAPSVISRNQAPGIPPWLCLPVPRGSYTIDASLDWYTTPVLWLQDWSDWVVPSLQWLDSLDRLDITMGLVHHG